MLLARRNYTGIAPLAPIPHQFVRTASVFSDQPAVLGFAR